MADLRAPTPSAAAEMAVPSQTELIKNLVDYDYTLKTLLLSNIKNKKLRLNSVKLLSPQDIIENNFLRLDGMTKDVINKMKQMLIENKEQFAGLVGKLDALSPLKVMQRGFAMPVDEADKVIKSVKELDKKKNFVLRLADGKRECMVKDKKGD